MGDRRNDRFRELCKHCGNTFGSHSGTHQNWCPANEGRMDFTKSTSWSPSGIFEEGDVTDEYFARARARELYRQASAHEVRARLLMARVAMEGES